MGDLPAPLRVRSCTQSWIGNKVPLSHARSIPIFLFTASMRTRSAGALRCWARLHARRIAGRTSVPMCQLIPPSDRVTDTYVTKYHPTGIISRQLRDTSKLRQSTDMLLRRRSSSSSTAEMISCQVHTISPRAPPTSFLTVARGRVARLVASTLVHVLGSPVNVRTHLVLIT